MCVRVHALPSFCAQVDGLAEASDEWEVIDGPEIAKARSYVAAWAGLPMLHTCVLLVLVHDRNNSCTHLSLQYLKDLQISKKPSCCSGVIGGVLPKH